MDLTSRVGTRAPILPWLVFRRARLFGKRGPGSGKTEGDCPRSAAVPGREERPELRGGGEEPRSVRGAVRFPLQPSLPPGCGFGSPSHVVRCGQGGNRTAVPVETATPTAEFLPKKASSVRTGFVSLIPAIGEFCFVAERGVLILKPIFNVWCAPWKGLRSGNPFVAMQPEWKRGRREVGEGSPL